MENSFCGQGTQGSPDPPCFPPAFLSSPSAPPVRLLLWLSHSLAESERSAPHSSGTPLALCSLLCFIFSRHLLSWCAPWEPRDFSHHFTEYSSCLLILLGRTVSPMIFNLKGKKELIKLIFKSSERSGQVPWPVDARFYLSFWSIRDIACVTMLQTMILWEKIVRTDLIRKYSNGSLGSMETCHCQPLTSIHSLYGTKMVTSPYSYFCFATVFPLCRTAGCNREGNRIT